MDVLSAHIILLELDSVGSHPVRIYGAKEETVKTGHMNFKNFYFLTSAMSIMFLILNKLKIV